MVTTIAEWFHVSLMFLHRLSRIRSWCPKGVLAKNERGIHWIGTIEPLCLIRRIEYAIG
jgi:hypothetical protein